MLFNTFTDVRLCRVQDGKLNQVFDVIYQMRKTVFDQISKHRVEILRCFEIWSAASLTTCYLCVSMFVCVLT